MSVDQCAVSDTDDQHLHHGLVLALAFIEIDVFGNTYYPEFFIQTHSILLFSLRGFNHSQGFSYLHYHHYYVARSFFFLSSRIVHMLETQLQLDCTLGSGILKSMFLLFMVASDKTFSGRINNC